MDFEVRELPPPEYDTIRALRGSRDGIQRLAARGLDVAKYEARLDNHNTSRRMDRWTDLPFIAWDGEGWTDQDGEHRYNYFANSLGYYLEYPLLGTAECLNLIMEVGAQYPDSIHVIYGGGYDVTHIVRDMPPEYREALKDQGTVFWDGYRLEYIPHKWFTVRRKVGDRKVSVTIYDVMTFFQTSFIKALSSRGIEVPQEVIDGKAARSGFRPEDMEAIKIYTGLELHLLVELCNTLRAEFREAGMPVRKYYGPGAVADAVNKQYRVRRHMQDFGPEMESVCQRAYFGGRFEPFQVGHHEGRVYQADICSAYPDKIRDLPSLDGARWEYRDSFTGELGIWRCTQSTPGAYLHPAPWRAHTGAVGFPPVVDEVWLWTYEAQHCSAVYEGWVLVLASDDKPFDFIPGMYATRREWKRMGRGGHWALKLALNSLYGKMAQRVGGRDGKPPKYHQLAWAGMVTSATRAQLWEGMQQDPDSVIAVETDSIMTTRRLDLPYGNELGQWELGEYDWVTYLQSGIYWTDDGLKVKTKTRGVDPSELTHDMVLAYLAGDQSVGLQTSVHRFISLTNPDITNYGQWLDTPRELSINGGKRWHVRDTCPDCLDGLSLAETMHRMTPAVDMGLGPSKPHPLPWRTDVAPNLTLEPGESAEVENLGYYDEYI